MAEEKDVPLRDYFVVIPFFGASVSASFDVGYFFGIDINFFTFFSLSEHINFALEVLPLALLFCVAVAIMLIVLRHRRLHRLLLKNGPLGSTKTSKRKKFFHSWGPYVVLTGFLLFNIYLFHWHWVFLYTALLVFMAFAKLWPLLLLDARSILAYMGSASLVFSFIFGFHTAREYVGGISATHKIVSETGTTEGRLVRAGERGVLFFDTTTRETSIIVWSGIQRISRLSKNLGV